jgi:hypothetical protein
VSLISVVSCADAKGTVNTSARQNGSAHNEKILNGFMGKNSLRYFYRKLELCIVLRHRREINLLLTLHAILR